MKMKNTEFEVFNFWKENKISGFFQLTKQELIEKFQEWLPSRDLTWHSNYSTMDAINCFVSDGLNSVGNTEDSFAEYTEMEKILKPIRRAYLDNLEKRLNS